VTAGASSTAMRGLHDEDGTPARTHQCAGRIPPRNSSRRRSPTQAAPPRVHGFPRFDDNRRCVTTTARNSHTTLTQDSNCRRGRLPWTITTPLGHIKAEPPAPKGFTDGATDSSWRLQFLPLALSLSLSLSLRNGGVHEGLPRSTGGTWRHIGGFLSQVNATLTSPIHARAERRGRRTRKTSDSHCPGGPTCKLTRAERGAGPNVRPHRRFVASSARGRQCSAGRLTKWSHLAAPDFVQLGRAVGRPNGPIVWFQPGWTVFPFSFSFLFSFSHFPNSNLFSNLNSNIMVNLSSIIMYH
jgi:hypothetical protein